MEPILLKLSGLSAEDITVVVAGISVVLGALILLIFIFYIFGILVSKIEAARKKRATKKAAEKMKADPTGIHSVPMPKMPAVQMPAAPAVEPGISGEVVAAISAAVYSIEGSGAKIRSIRKQSPVTSRNPWAQAAVTDNTRPF